METSARQRYRRSGAVLVVVGLMCAVLGVTASAGAAETTGLTTSDPNVAVTPGGEDCNGIVPTPGSENTVKTLTGGTLEPGGTATFRVTYPIDPADVGETFEVVDCVLIASPPYPDALNKYDSLDEATFSGVAANTDFELNMALAIPDDVAVGTRICNVAKTTEGPTAPQSSNRKAGPACFIVGGDVRIEKRAAGGPDRDPDNPDDGLLTGAVFDFACVNAAEKPADQPIVINGVSYPTAIVTASGVVSTDGAIEVSGASGSTCLVTEVTPPDGYELPADVDQTFTIQPGSQVVVEFRDPAEAETTTTTSSTTTSTSTTTPTSTTTSTTIPRTVCCDVPLPTTTTAAPTTTTTGAPQVLPTVVEQTTTTTAAPPAPTSTARVLGVQLARTGGEAGVWLKLAGLLLCVGGLFLFASDRRVWALMHRR